VLSQQGAGILFPFVPSVHNKPSLGLSGSSGPFGMASSFLPSSFRTALRGIGCWECPCQNRSGLFSWKSGVAVPCCAQRGRREVAFSLPFLGG
ncbi:hypothetical protein CIB84_004208, partial [Bambusicola thoracicus]